VNWVSDGVDCCHIGLLTHAYIEQGKLWDSMLCQVVDVFEKNYPSKLQREKWHHNKGYASIAIISDMPFGTGALPQKKDKDVGKKGGGKKGN
jgi:hypothetical protein